MFASSVQPGTVSLFSSTNSEPLGLFSQHTDSALPSDSVIHLLHDATSSPSPSPPATLINPDVSEAGSSTHSNSMHALDQTVLHVQSPTLKTTYIRSPPKPRYIRPALPPPNSGGDDLGLQHPWLHLQVRNLGRPWSFEVGLVDKSGSIGIVRCSTFQDQPRLVASRPPPSPPLLHLPLAFPSLSPPCLTAWCTIAVYLPSLLARFALDGDGEGVARKGILPLRSYSHIAYIKVYATCRLRRIWLSQYGPDQTVPWEFDLYGIGS